MVLSEFLVTFCPFKKSPAGGITPDSIPSGTDKEKKTPSAAGPPGPRAEKKSVPAIEGTKRHPPYYDGECAEPRQKKIKTPRSSGGQRHGEEAKEGENIVVGGLPDGHRPQKRQQKGNNAKSPS